MTLSTALSGVRVLDLSRLLPGPFATKLLVDLGAQVDKIEDPGPGDYLRHMPPQREGENAAFVVLNAGKRGGVIDLKTEGGRARFFSLLPRYDVVVESFRPGTLDRLGVGHAAMRERHPGLVICALTGFGQRGPDAQRAGHDLGFCARSGLLALTGPSEGPPVPLGGQVADVGGALYAALAILAALRQRDQSGQGQVLDISLTESALTFATLPHSLQAAGHSAPRGQDVLSGGLATYRCYATADHRFMALAILEPKFLSVWNAAAGTNLPPHALLPGPHQAALVQELTQLFAQRSFAEWRALAAAHDCCLEPVLALEELEADPHLRQRGVLGAGGFRTPLGPASALSAPARGEHDAEIGASTEKKTVS